jgi:hypothetical protein
MEQRRHVKRERISLGDWCILLPQDVNGYSRSRDRSERM